MGAFFNDRSIAFDLYPYRDKRRNVTRTMNGQRKICTIGGGSGMPVVNKGLLNAGCERVLSIVTTFDSGGDTGRLRTDERGQVLAFSDYWRSLISLWEDSPHKSNWAEMLRFRDGRERNFGNTFFQFMSEKAGNLSLVDSLFGELVGADIRGEVIPVSLQPSDICFRTQSGKLYRGEHHLDDLRMSLDRVVDIWLDPPVKANPEALQALREAELIIICPGSLYGSILTNFLPQGMIQAYNRSTAFKLLLTNIMSVANENNNYDQNDYAALFARYLGTDSPFDLIVMPDLDHLETDLLAETLALYELEHSQRIRYNPDSVLPTVLADVSIIERRNRRLRHCEEKLGRFFRSRSFQPREG